MKSSPMNIRAAVCLASLTLMTAATATADPPTPAAMAQPEKCYTGLVTTVDPAERSVSVRRPWRIFHLHFSLGEHCAYAMLDKNPGTINDLRPGEEVRVSCRDAYGVLIADRIEQQPMRCEGRVAAIDPDKHTLSLHRPGLDKQMLLASGCLVVLRGDKPGTFAEVKPGDHVTVTYELPDNVPTARAIAQTSIRFSGSLTAVDLAERTVKAKSTFESKTFHLADHCAIAVNGKTDGQLADLKPEDKLVFSYDEINGVNVVNRIASANSEAERSYVSAPTPDSGASMPRF